MADWKRPGVALRMREMATSGHDDDGRREPQVDDRLGDRQVDRADLGELDEGLKLELLGDVDLALGAARDEEQAHQHAESDHDPDEALGLHVRASRWAPERTSATVRIGK